VLDERTLGLADSRGNKQYVTIGNTIMNHRMPLPVGHTLTLQIRWQGNTYEATELVLVGVPMDSLIFTPAESGIDDDDSGLHATIAARDPGNQRNFYLWDQFVDGRRLVSPNTDSYSRVVISDELFNGGFLRAFQPYERFGLRSGQSVNVRQLSIPERVVCFNSALSEQSANDGSPFGVAPSSVRGNVANVSRPSQVALGYFIAGEYSELERTVP